jgi:acetoin utilization protein AcuB
MLIKDWMTRDPITITEETSMIKAIHIMKERRFRRLPVVSAGKLVGMITDRDLKEASPSKATTLDVHELYYLLAELQVREIMTRNPLSVNENDTVERAAQVMLEHTISGLPVVDAGGKVVGIITQSDVFRAFMHITGVLQGGVQFALRLEDRPGVLKEAADLLRAKGGRMVSLLTAYPSPESNQREVYIRVKNLSPEAAEAARAELASRFQLLYVIQEGEAGPAA